VVVGKVSESKMITEKTLTPAQMKKREEIAKAIERDQPGIDMSRKMAIATATAKRVAENAMVKDVIHDLAKHVAKKTRDPKTLRRLSHQAANKVANMTDRNKKKCIKYEDAPAGANVASIPNPATTAMGPKFKPMSVTDRRRKKDKTVLLKRFRTYMDDKNNG
jgi:hypothetical protein